MKVLLIGGTGNLSTDCAALLHRRGHEITLVNRGNAPQPPAYRHLCANRKDAISMEAAVRDEIVDVVINFLGFDVADMQIDHAIFRGRIHQYIFISSATVYAKPHRQLPLTENAPLGNAYWDYAQRKLHCEEWLLDRRQHDHFPVTIVRPSHTYSPRWFPNVVSSAGWTFASRLLAGKPTWVPDDGNNPWTLTHTSDFAVGLAGLVGNDAAIGESFHITSDEVLSWNQIYAETAAALGVTLPHVEKIPTDFICEHVPELVGPLRGDKCNPGVFDNSKIKHFVPGFACRKRFHDGIRDSADWYHAHPGEKIVNAQADALFDCVIARYHGR